jgi:hypothetical protein
MDVLTLAVHALQAKDHLRSLATTAELTSSRIKAPRKRGAPVPARARPAGGLRPASAGAAGRTRSDDGSWFPVEHGGEDPA